MKITKSEAMRALGLQRHYLKKINKELLPYQEGYDPSDIRDVREKLNQLRQLQKELFPYDGFFIKHIK